MQLTYVYGTAPALEAEYGYVSDDACFAVLELGDGEIVQPFPFVTEGAMLGMVADLKNDGESVSRIA